MHGTYVIRTGRTQEKKRPRQSSCRVRTRSWPFVCGLVCGGQLGGEKLAQVKTDDLSVLDDVDISTKVWMV